MDNVIDLSHLWQVVRRNLSLILAMGVIFAAIGFTVSKFLIHPEYSSSTAVLVNRKQDDNNSGMQFQNQQADVQLISTYKDIIKRPVILNQVADNLTEKHTEKKADGTKKEVPAKYTKSEVNADNLANMISISNQQNSQVFSVNVKTGDPDLSKDIANEVAKVFQKKVGLIMSSASDVSIVSKATANPKPVSPKVPLITLISFVVGLIVGLAWAWIRDLTDRTVKTISFLTDDLGLTNLGVVGYIGKMRSIDETISRQNNGKTSGQRSERNRRI
ncbi:capsular biosynthesis protein [Weissella viridescens]|uniref:Capsular polysaccharide biosynthesis protein CpsC n=1 Tax=Weissella viridescens TaxID=1629 RepID=A0A3P2RHC1_WEIVI|nr:Wzz/FepE/Etk N-terminal domain-containing protein [Weissella viridescens]RRG18150.1 capsular biosynthesis protein [Weissella viridescens]